MALQDVCGFRDSPMYPRWNCPASLSMTMGDTTIEYEGGELIQGEMNSTKRERGTPLSLYVPAPEHLTQNLLHANRDGQDSAPIAPPFALSHGTTTLAFVFQGGIMAAADTRASCSGLVSCPAAQKILPLHSHLVVTTSGSAADCMLWERILARECRLYQLRHRRRLSIGGAAKLLSHMLHPFKGTEMCVAAMLCGWDRGQEGGAGSEGWDRGDGGSPGFAEDGGGGLEGGEGTSVRDMEEGEGRRTERNGEGEVGVALRGGETSRRGAQRDRPEGGVRDPAVTKQLLGGVSVTTNRKPPELSAQEAGEPQKHRAEGKTIVWAGSDRTTSQIRGGADTGPRLYYVCSDGTRLQGELFSVGSGSPYAYSVLDGGVRWGLGVAEACSLAREAVYRAAHRDAYSGNCVDLYHITAHGWRRRKREDLKEEYYREKERERERMEERRKERERERKEGEGEGRSMAPHPINL